MTIDHLTFQVSPKRGYPRLLTNEMRQSVAHWIREPERGQHAHLLITHAAQHLDAAAFGLAMTRDVEQKGMDSVLLSQFGFGGRTDVVQLAAANLTFRGIVTSFDLCGAVAFHLTRQPLSSGREWDMGRWEKNKKRGEWPAALPVPIREWLSALIDDQDWQQLQEFRHAYTHRMVTQHVRIGSAATEIETTAARRTDQKALMQHSMVKADAWFRTFLDSIPKLPVADTTAGP